LLLQTQEMVKRAQENYPNLEASDAIQLEADKGPGREAAVGEGSATRMAVENVKETLEVCSAQCFFVVPRLPSCTH
jgi:hypothetical protein